MKKLNFTFALICILTLFSCEKDKELTPNPTSQGSMTAMVDGASWTSSSASGARMNGVLNVTGTTANGSVIVITLFDKGVGTYNLNGASEGNAGYQITSGGVAFTADSDPNASVIITKIDATNKTLSGTFSFKVYRSSDSLTKVITEGKFTDIKFITELTGGGNNNTLSADIDGSLFTAPVVTGVILPSLNKIGVTGSDNNGSKSIGFQLPDNIAVGSYTFDGVAGNYVGQYNASSSEFYFADSGNLVISKHDVGAKKIEGTFNFIAKDFGGVVSISITNGKFSTTY